MALSEHEQRLLDQIEQALYAEDPEVRGERALGSSSDAAPAMDPDQHSRGSGWPCRRAGRAGGQAGRRRRHRLRTDRRIVRICRRNAQSQGPDRSRTQQVEGRLTSPRRDSPESARGWKTGCAAASTSPDGGLSTSRVLPRRRTHEAGQQPSPPARPRDEAAFISSLRTAVNWSTARCQSSGDAQLPVDASPAA